jgi:hypothetical protein
MSELARLGAGQAFANAHEIRSHVCECVIIMLQRVEALDVALRQPESPRLAKSDGAQCAAAEAWILTDIDV